MFATTKDILNIALAGGFILVVIFLCVMILYIVLILRDINKITSHTKDTVKKVNEYIVHPFKFIYYFGETLKPVYEIIQEKIQEKVDEYKKDKKKKNK
ncbi:hypothetical protein HYV57_00525 [Candidatus Peregrinibacteria bacterium]|nr:hypothetical protein [Candidatus Peregrinibacteria bacterium]